jgi:hypothetical protein
VESSGSLVHLYISISRFGGGCVSTVEWRSAVVFRTTSCFSISHPFVPFTTDTTTLNTYRLPPPWLTHKIYTVRNHIESQLLCHFSSLPSFSFFSLIFIQLPLTSGQQLAAHNPLIDFKTHPVRIPWTTPPFNGS